MHSELPRRLILGNSASGVRDSRKLRRLVREEKGRGVENPGGKVSWTLYRRG